MYYFMRLYLCARQRESAEKGNKIYQYIYQYRFLYYFRLYKNLKKILHTCESFNNEFLLS